ncbi:hypothetical protein EBZ80_02315 [bacterium]|nr:hypothetical protein [bacterium]
MTNKWTEKSIFLSFLVYKGIKEPEDFLDRVDELGQDWHDKASSLLAKVMNFDQFVRKGESHLCKRGKQVCRLYADVPDATLLAVWSAFYR